MRYSYRERILPRPFKRFLVATVSLPKLLDPQGGLASLRSTIQRQQFVQAIAVLIAKLFSPYTKKILIYVLSWFVSNQKER